MSSDLTRRVVGPGTYAESLRLLNAHQSILADTEHNDARRKKGVNFT